MGQIFGNPETIKRVRDAKAGDIAVHVNMDAIEQLPDEYESTIVEVDYNIEHDFADVGTESKPSYYPMVHFMNKIAEKRGIEGYGESVIELIYEDVNISLMEISDEPCIMKLKVGYIVKKQGAIMQEDGKMKPSSIRVGMYNAWEECSLLWTKEEMYTEGYAKKGKYPPQYATKWKRRYHFKQQIDKALGIADSVAWSKCIRELTGLQTGYKAGDLKEGKFYFAKIRRSKNALKAETAARLSAIAQGHSQIEQKTEQLFGEQKPEPEFEAPKPKDSRLELISILNAYVKEKLITKEVGESVTGLIGWLESDNKAEDNTKYWNAAINVLKKVESTIPAEGKIDHKFY